jgi:hypothetical protein
MPIERLSYRIMEHLMIKRILTKFIVQKGTFFTLGVGIRVFFQNPA